MARGSSKTNSSLGMMLRPFVCMLLLAVSGLAQSQSWVADAAMAGDEDEVSRLLQEGLDVNGAQADGATALHWAAYHGDGALAALLLEAGADPSIANRNGSTPLWLAASQGDDVLVEILLEGGADANESLPLGRRPLMLAARAGSVDAVSTLIAYGADVNAVEDDRGTSALMQAADQGHADVIQLLIELGADYSMGSKPVMRDGRTAALGNAGDPREGVRRQVVAILCEEEEVDMAALTELITESSNDIWVELVNSGEALTEESICGKVRRSGLGFVQVTDGTRAFGRQAGDDSATDTNDEGFLLAEEAQAEEALPGAEPVVVDGEAVTASEEEAGESGLGGRGNREPDGGELTPLVYAARAGHIDAARALLNAGADVNQITRYGWTPLLAATQNREYQMGKFLIEHGADVNIANKGGWTNLYLATDNRNVEGGDYPTPEPDMDDMEYIGLLLDEGADPNAQLSESTETRTVFTNQWLDEEGATAFLRASQSGDVALMELLLEYGADPFIYTDLDVTPLQVAAGIGWVEGITSEWSTEQTNEAVRMLLDLGMDPNFQADTGRTALHGAAHKGSTDVVRMLVDAGARLDVRDFGNTDNRGSPELAAHTWLPIDYADGLVRVGVQSSIPHPETAAVIRELMLEAGLTPPPENRTVESICIVEVCSPNYDPVELN